MVQTLIINEKKYVEDIICSSVVPDNVTPNILLMYLTKYYYTIDITLEQITEAVCNQMKLFNFTVDQYQEYNAVPRIKRIFNNIRDNKLPLLRTQEFVPIYQSEYQKILSCQTDKQKKVLFTLYILARYTNKYGWVYNEERDIYKLANTTKSKNDVIAELMKQKLIKTTKKVNDLKIGVDLSDGGEEIAIKVDNIAYLGNQLLSHLKTGYKMCGNVNCGKLIKIKTQCGRPIKYCDDCAKLIDKENKKLLMKNLRKNKNNV